MQLKFGKPNRKIKHVVTYLNDPDRKAHDEFVQWCYDLMQIPLWVDIKASQVTQFDLPGGYTCPKANECKAFYNPRTRKVIEGKNMKYRCYCANNNVQFPNTAPARWHNFNMLRGKTHSEMTHLLNHGIQRKKICRIHGEGGMFNMTYACAWLSVAILNPTKIFYGYTKVMDVYDMVAHHQLPNFKLSFSLGSLDDDRVTPDTVTAGVVRKADELSVCYGPGNEYQDFVAIMQGRKLNNVIH